VFAPEIAGQCIVNPEFIKFVRGNDFISALIG